LKKGAREEMDVQVAYLMAKWIKILKLVCLSNYYSLTKLRSTPISSSPSSMNEMNSHNQKIPFLLHLGRNK
jgi:hypothetical protein